MTQKELDEAVIAAAEAYVGDDREGSFHNPKYRDVIKAVRARREAMKPSKLRLLAAACRTGTSSPNAHQIATSIEWYLEDGTPSLKCVRDLLARILAAPDEPTEAK